MNKVLLALLFLCLIVPAQARAADTKITLDPTSGPVGTTVKIFGTGFGTTAGSVNFNGTVAKSITSWTDTEIDVVVPAGAQTGIVVIIFGTTTIIAPTPFTVSASSASTALQTNASMYTRAVVGLDVSAASSESAQTKAFLEFNLMAPLFLGKGALKLSEGLASDQTCLATMGQMLDATNAQASTYQWSGAHLSDFYFKCYTHKDEAADDHYDDADVASAILDMLPTYANGKPNYDPSAKATLSDQNRETITKLVRHINEEMALRDTPLSRRSWIWLNPRISGDPQALSSAFSTLTAGTTGAQSQNLNSVVQSFDFLGGLMLTVMKPRPWFPFGDSAMQSVSLLLEGGLSAPLTATAGNAQIFMLNSNLTPQQITSIFGSNPPAAICKAGQTPTANSCTQYVAFFPPDLPRFYKQYSAGLRISTYFFKSNKPSDDNFGLCSGKMPGMLCDIFPGTFDITVGQNSAITGGGLNGVVLRTEAFYPLPFYPPLHLFFTTWTHLGKGGAASQSLPPLDTAGSSITVSTAGVQAVSLSPTNRDFYRIGIGIDLVTFINQLKSSSANKAAATAAATPASTTTNTTTGAAPAVAK